MKENKKEGCQFAHLTALAPNNGPQSLKSSRCSLLAESQGFEPWAPERCNGFRDHLLRPLGQLSL